MSENEGFIVGDKVRLAPDTKDAWGLRDLTGTVQKVYGQRLKRADIEFIKEGESYVMFLFFSEIEKVGNERD